jgi:hypothetical protein
VVSSREVPCADEKNVGPAAVGWNVLSNPFDLLYVLTLYFLVDILSGLSVHWIKLKCLIIMLELIVFVFNSVFFFFKLGDLTLGACVFTIITFCVQ